MSDVRLRLDAALGIVLRDLQVTLSYRARFLTGILGGFFSLTLFYYISRLVQVQAFPSPDAYYAFAVVGLITLQVLNSTLSLPPASLRQELVAGNFERIVVSPYGPTGAVFAMLVFPFLNALFFGVWMLVFAGLVFGVDVEWAKLPLVVPVGLLGAMAFAPFGVLLLATVLIFKQALAGTTWIVAGISLIAGLYFPVTLLPDWIEWASDVQPFTPAVDLMRNVLVGTPLTDPVWLDLVRLLGFTALLMPACVWSVHAAIRRSRREGSIIEY